MVEDEMYVNFTSPFHDYCVYLQLSLKRSISKVTSVNNALDLCLFYAYENERGEVFYVDLYDTE